MRARGDLGEHFTRDASEVTGREPLAELSCLEAREREKLLGETSGAVTARDHLIERVRTLVVASRSACHLRLRADRGQRRPQLVRGIGGEGALPLERCLDSREELVQSIDQDAHLARNAIDPDRLEALRIACGDGFGERSQGGERAPDREDQACAEEWQRDHERYEQVSSNLCADRFPRVDSFGHLHEHAAIQRPGAEDPPAHAVDPGVTEARLLRRELLSRRVLRVQAKSATVLPNLERDVSRVAVELGRVLEFEFVVVVVVVTALGDLRDEQGGRLREMGVEEIVHLVARAQPTCERHAEPHDRHRAEDGTDESAAERGGPAHVKSFGSR